MPMMPRAPLMLLLLCSCPGGATAGESTKPAPEQRPAAADAEPAAPARVVLLPAGREPVAVSVEIARTEAQRRRGLMFRQQLDESAGMLFLFDRPDQLSFWMRNTYIPLDMIFIEPSLRVLGVVENAEPMTDVPRLVPGISQYVLEVNAGFSRQHGIGSGTVVRFEGVDLPDPQEASP